MRAAGLINDDATVLLHELLALPAAPQQLMHFSKALAATVALKQAGLSLPDARKTQLESYFWRAGGDGSGLRHHTSPMVGSDAFSSVFRSAYIPWKGDIVRHPEFLSFSEMVSDSYDTILFPLAVGSEMLGIFWLSVAPSSMPGNMLESFVVDLSILRASLAALKIQEHEAGSTTLLSLSSELSKVQDKNGLYQVIEGTLKSLFRFKGFAIALISDDGLHHNAFLFNCDHYDTAEITFDTAASIKYDVNDGLFNRLIHAGQPLRVRIDDLADPPPYVQLWKSFNSRSFVAIPLHMGGKPLGVLYLIFDNDDTSIPHRNLLVGICEQLAMSVSNIVAVEKINEQLEQIGRYKDQLEEERIYLHAEANRQYEFNDIIGEGPVMRNIFQLISQVAATESTALIMGETGTGKELIARAIHNRSPRKDNLMVKLNCSAIPINLIESELFGHEKGSFTGAIERRIGKFELANNGTLFLDEIGEMPLDMQAKLLRALQEREIERIGGKATIKVNVRIIAATNRNLAQEVAAGKFRNDLYYRLNVFPIIVPPLRDRLDDLPLLVAYFIDKLSKKTGRNISNISEKAMDTLLKYPWPGNIRELEHLIERSMLMAKGNTIREVPLNYSAAADANTIDNGSIKTLAQAERDYIVHALNRCDGKVFGPGGAAELLGVKRSTLISKMIKLGIAKEKTTFK